MHIQKLPYLVAIVIPSLGRKAEERLTKVERNAIIQMALKRFEELFGGATPMKIPPGGIVRLTDGTVLVDHNQTLVVSGTTRGEFLRWRKEVEHLALQVGEKLDQESVAVLAFASDSFLLIRDTDKGEE
ncbi:hypothetical protein HY772_04565 [Candidatus Woesearchaeota archaeon]|nr:hypothetical protein [Candidatus Woesearchaeota archaeon]